MNDQGRRWRCSASDEEEEEKEKEKMGEVVVIGAKPKTRSIELDDDTLLAYGTFESPTSINVSTPSYAAVAILVLSRKLYFITFQSCSTTSLSIHSITANLKPFSQESFVITALFISLMAFNSSVMPSFLSRFLRPFTSSASLSLNSEPLSMQNFPENTQKATFAAGCFWGPEHVFRKAYGNGKGLLDARVGYTGGGTAAPSYRAVCSGTTGHAESILLLFDPDKVSYKTLVEVFFRTHDPTTKDQQGPDRGSQYRSAIFANTEEQLKIAEEAKAEVQEKWNYNQSGSPSPVTTEIKMAGPWYDAEDYHQLYLDKNPFGYHCPSHHYRQEFPPLFGHTEKAGEKELGNKKT